MTKQTEQVVSKVGEMEWVRVSDVLREIADKIDETQRDPLLPPSINIPLRDYRIVLNAADRVDVILWKDGLKQRYEPPPDTYTYQIIGGELIGLDTAT